LAISTAPTLSSNILHLIVGASNFGITFIFDASLDNDIRGKISLAAVDNAIYSASVTDSAISVCIFDAHTTG
jgi:hypothetical protein